MKGETLFIAMEMANSGYDFRDSTAWLNKLHEEEIPFPTEAVVII